MMNPRPGQQFRLDHGILIMKLTASVFRIRIGFALACFLLAAGLVSFAAQPPEVEDPKGAVKKKIGVEDEDPKGTVKKKIVVDDDPTPKAGGPATPTGTPPDAR